MNTARLTTWIFGGFGVALAAPSLLAAWRHSPIERFMPLAFAAWLLPPALAACRRRSDAAEAQSIWPAAALLMGAAALLTDLNAVAHLAAAAGLAGILRLGGAWPHLVWASAAVVWMPAGGWLTSAWAIAPGSVVRTVCAAVAGLLLAASLRRMTSLPS